MSQKEIAFKDEARKALKNGVDLLANAVKVTLGAKGRYVVFKSKNGQPHPTKDGVTVAKEVETVDILEQLGVSMTREASLKAAEEAGDGTTTATVLTQEMVNEGYKYVTAGSNPIDLKRGIDKAISQVVAFLNKIAKPVNIKDGTIKQVAVISANGDEYIGSLVSEAYAKIGEKGMVTVNESSSHETYSEVLEGVKIERGYAQHYFITNPATKEAILNNPYILLYDDKIDSFRELTPILTEIGQQGKSILIIANDFEGEVLATLAANKIRNILKINAIKAPNFGELNREVLNDIAAATNAKVISKKAGMSLEKTLIQDLGYAEKIISDNVQTMIIGGESSENFDEYLKGLEEQSKKDVYAKERIARLMGGVAVINVGAMTGGEMKEKKDRVDDAVAAVKATIEEGIVIGGGAALIKAIKTIDDTDYRNFDEKLGIEIVKKALKAPLRTIVENSGNNGEIALYLVENNSDENIGYDVVTEKVVDMYKAGIIDPKKVTRVALESAASVAGTILTTDCVIAEY